MMKGLNYLASIRLSRIFISLEYILAKKKLFDVKILEFLNYSEFLIDIPSFKYDSKLIETKFFS